MPKPITPLRADVTDEDVREALNTFCAINPGKTPEQKMRAALEHDRIRHGFVPQRLREVQVRRAILRELSDKWTFDDVARAARAILAARDAQAGGGEADAAFPKPKSGSRIGKEPCGECHIELGETCDLCGAAYYAAPTDTTLLGTRDGSGDGPRASNDKHPSHVTRSSDAEHYQAEVRSINRMTDREINAACRPATPLQAEVAPTVDRQPVAQDIEDLSAKLLDAWDDELNPRHGAAWPEHDKDDGYRDGGYIRLQSSDVQARMRAFAKRVYAITHPASDEVRRLRVRSYDKHLATIVYQVGDEICIEWDGGGICVVRKNDVEFIDAALREPQS